MAPKKKSGLSSSSACLFLDRTSRQSRTIFTNKVNSSSSHNLPDIDVFMKGEVNFWKSMCVVYVCVGERMEIRGMEKERATKKDAVEV